MTTGNLHYNTNGNDSQIVQSGLGTRSAAPWSRRPISTITSLPGRAVDVMKSFTITNGVFNTTPVSAIHDELWIITVDAGDFRQWHEQRHCLGDPGASLRQRGPGVLHAYNATNLARSFTTPARTWRATIRAAR